MWSFQALLIGCFLLQAHATDTIFPKFTKQPPNEEIVLKNLTTLQCEAKGKNITYYWKKDGKKFEWTKYRHDVNSGTIIVNEAGKYQCFAKNENGIATSNIVSLRSAFLINKNNTQKTVRVKENQPAVLKCGDVVGWPKPTIDWTYKNSDGKPIALDLNRESYGNLFFSNIQRSHNNSRIACHLKNGITLNEYTLVVELNYKSQQTAPTKQYAESNVIAVANKSIEIYCIYGGSPTPTITWKRNNIKIENDDRFNLSAFNRSLIINNVKPEDEGPYICDVSNNVNTTSHTTYLTVNESPRFKSDLKDKIAYVGEFMEFQCKVEGKPKPKIQWFFNGEPISKIKRSNLEILIDGSSLNVSNITLNDRGIYGCNAKNSVDNIYQEFSFDVLNSKSLVEEKTVEVLPKIPSENPGDIKFEMSKDCSVVKISWNQIAENVIGYRVYWKSDSMNKFFENTTNETSISISNQFYKRYHFKIISFNEYGESKAKAVEQKFDGACDFQAFPLDNTSFLLRWKKPDVEIKSYKISYQEYNATNDLQTKNERILSIDQNVITQAKMIGLKSNTIYRLTISTVDKQNQEQIYKVIEEKTLSTERSGMPDLSSLTWIQIPTSNKYSVRVTWMPNIDGNPGSNFYVKYRIKDNKNWIHTDQIYDKDFIIVNNLLLDKSYDFAIVSVGKGGKNNTNIKKFVTITIVKVDITRKKSDFELEGSEMELNCTIRNIKLKSIFSNLAMDWEWPNKIISSEDERIKQLDPIRENCVEPLDEEKCDLVYRLIVSKLNKTKDTGIYRCNFKSNGWIVDTAAINVNQILGICNPFVHINPLSAVNLTVNSGEEAKWIVELIGYPNPSFDWQSNKGDTIPWRSNPSNKIVSFNSTENGKNLTLTLSNLTVKDSGIYTLYAENGKGEQNKNQTKFRLNVKGKPELEIIKQIVVKENMKAHAKCNIFAYPKVNVSWTFETCSTSESCESKNLTNDNFNTTETEYNLISTASFIPEKNGIIICRASNKYDSSEKMAQIFINDLDTEFEIRSDNETIVINYTASVACKAASFKYSDVNWYRNGSPVDHTTVQGVEVKTKETSFSIRKIMYWNRLTEKSKGNYICQAKNKETNQNETLDYILNAVEPEAPTINQSNFDNEAIWKVKSPLEFNLTCYYSGVPRPILTWYKYDNDNVRKPLTFTDSYHESLEDDGKRLAIKYTRDGDEGKYECEAKYGEIAVQRSVTIEIIVPISVVPWYKSNYFIFGLLTLIISLLICSILLTLAVCRHRKQLKRAGLRNFEDGDINGLNPELALDVQADLLPYDKQYEFPRNKLKLGKELGAGAFGIVLEATAQEIIAHEKETKVAVKMVKKFANNEVMRALVSELKIMIHLGQHLNVVNLLGAVTKDITKFNLMVIVEYCPFGNLHSFLAKNRQNFVNQIVPGTDEINVELTSMDIPSSSTFSTFNSKIDGKFLYNLANVFQSKSNTCSVFDRANTSTEPLLQSRNTTTKTSDNVVMVDESTDTPSRSVTTKDLLIWSFQIARGMDYLASRKVLHGDLAARNILLCEDNVVKICDFGLARSLYKNENYCMKSKRALPFKWLALESLNDCVFSTCSDVWSFGIVLWELFSLGATPYSDIRVDELKDKLNDGYRMEKPEFATQNIYDIMLSCWYCNPDKRPKFNELVNHISKIIGKTELEHYIDLNEPYLKANESRFNSGETDYLALLGSPDCPAPSVPVNELREKYFPFLVKSSDDTLTATNGLYVANNTPLLSKKILNNQERPIPLKSFKPNNLN